MSDVANTMKSAEQYSEIVNRLFNCTVAEQVTDTFTKYGIKSTEDRIALLHQCMNIEEYFDSPQKKLSAEDEYDYTLAVFTEGSWRLLVNG